MPRFLNPRGRATYGIALCARCAKKFFIDQLYSDPNSPGLMVCRKDLDEFDPYRLPARETEPIVLPFVRRDVDITIPPGGSPTPNWYATSGGIGDDSQYTAGDTHGFVKPITAYVLSLVTGHFTFSGHAATLATSISGHFNMIASTGAYNITGHVGLATYARTLTGVVGHYVMTGNDAALAPPNLSNNRITENSEQRVDEAGNRRITN